MFKKKQNKKELQEIIKKEHLEFFKTVNLEKQYEKRCEKRMRKNKG